MQLIRDEAPAGPQIVENYRDFEPPQNFRRLLGDLLKTVPAEYLAELKTIILANQSALTRDQRRQRVWGRKRKVRLAEALGTYHHATRSSPAIIWLYVDNILRSEPDWIWRLPAVRYLPLSTVLYHEIGHHIHAAYKPIYKGKEDVADDWSRKLRRRFFRKRYWYLIPVAYLVSPLRRLVRWIKQKRNSTLMA
jgi:hypothetical protein